MPDASNQDEINELLDCCITLFSGTNTLIVLDGCTCCFSRSEEAFNKFIELAFSGKHFGISLGFDSTTDFNSKTFLG